MAKYQKYSEYQDSGIEWLGEIPNHWAMSKLRYLFDFSKGLSITKENLQDEGIPCVNYGEVHSKYGFEVNPQKHPLKCVNASYLKTSENALLNNGDFVFADTSEDLKGSGNFTHLVGDEQIFAGYHTVIARPHNANSSRFYAYLFDSKEFRSQIQLAVKGVKVFSITQAMLRSADAWLPSTDEQVKIANFLDHETAKIDSLIAKQEKLIELLKEKRQAMISHAVTKGLNPDVAMKDSGVEWLGQVPEHWTVSKLKHFVNVVDCKHITAEFFDEGIPLASIGEVKGWKVNLSNAKLTNEKYYQELIDGNRKPQVGDIIYTRNATVGEASLVHAELPKFALGQDVCLIHIIQKLSSEYLLHFLKSEIIKIQLNSAMVGSTFKRINVDDIRNYVIVIPPIEEQECILKDLDQKIEKYDSLINFAVKQIQLMQERRTALISSAVTGKIDVRNWQHPNEAKTGLSA